VAVGSNAPDFQDSRGKLSEVYEQYRAELRRFFQFNARRAHSVDDLMQEMFLQLLASRPTAELRDAQRYLFTVAWNVLHSANRRVCREPEHSLQFNDEELDLLAAPSNRLWVEDDTTAALADEQLNRLLNQLPRMCQVAVLRHYRDGKSYKEIAEEINVSVHTVKKYIMKGLSQFRTQFETGDTDR